MNNESNIHLQLLETELHRQQQLVEQLKAENLALKSRIELLTGAKKTEQMVERDLDAICMIDEYQPVALFVADENTYLERAIAAQGEVS